MSNADAFTIRGIPTEVNATLPTEVLLEKPQARVIETTYAPGTPRTRYIRKTDHIIWHDKGEDAPELTNLGTKPYRTLTIELP